MTFYDVISKIVVGITVLIGVIVMVIGSFYILGKLIFN